jgi:hypothetical protein
MKCFLTLLAPASAYRSGRSNQSDRANLRDLGKLAIVFRVFRGYSVRKGDMVYESRNSMFGNTTYLIYAKL